MVERPPPTRIASKQTANRAGKTQSEMNMESISFDAPLLTELSAETPWAGGQVGKFCCYKVAFIPLLVFKVVFLIGQVFCTF